MTESETKFWNFHQKNPQVYDKLVEMTWQAKRVGRTRVGMKMMFEVLRWEHLMQTDSDDYRLNNNYAPYYARLVMTCDPRLDGMFETRAMR